MSGFVVLRGAISNYRSQRGAANFFFTAVDQQALGMVAIGAALVGAGGPAMGVAGSAADVEEEADHVEFTVDGVAVSGWVWRAPFKDGDVVEVVVEKGAGGHAVVAVARPKDRVIALYPHLSRGRWAHVLNVLKWWFWIMTILAIVMLIFMGTIFWAHGKSLVASGALPYVLLAVAVVAGLMLLPTLHMILKYMRFVRAAERVFEALQWKAPRFVDLIKSSNRLASADDAPERGVYYFRY